MVFLYIIILGILMSILIGLLIYSININIEINNFKFSSINNKFINDNFKLIFKIKLFGKITVFRYTSIKEKRLKLKAKKLLEEKENRKLRQSKNKIKEVDKYILKIKENIKVINKVSFFEKKKIFKYIKDNIFSSIKKINVNIAIGTDNPIVSSSIVPIVGTMLSYIFMESSIKKDSKFNIVPIYQNRNMLNIELDTKFNFKVSSMVKGIILIYKIISKNKNKLNRSKINKKIGIVKKSKTKVYKQIKKVNNTINTNT